MGATDTCADQWYGKLGYWEVQECCDSLQGGFPKGATQLNRQELIGELRTEEEHSGGKQQEQRHKVNLKWVYFIRMNQDQLIRCNTWVLCRPATMKEIEHLAGKKTDLVQFHLYRLYLNKKKADYRPREIAQSEDTIHRYIYMYYMFI